MTGDGDEESLHQQRRLFMETGRLHPDGSGGPSDEADREPARQVASAASWLLAVAAA